MSDNTDNTGKTVKPHIPDVYVVSGGYAWYRDESAELVFAHVITQEGQTGPDWAYPNVVDTRADECAIRLESDIADVLDDAHKAHNRYIQAVRDMETKKG